LKPDVKHACKWRPSSSLTTTTELAKLKSFSSLFPNCVAYKPCAQGKIFQTPVKALRNPSLKVDAKCPWNLHFAGWGEASDNKFIPTNQHRQSSFMQSSSQLSHHHHHHHLLVHPNTAIAILQLHYSQHLHRFL
jgi:hypothetical protein